MGKANSPGGDYCSGKGPRPAPTKKLRLATAHDFPSVSNLIFHSTNAWYQRHGRPAIFGGTPENCLLFCQVYEDLDPGCCVVAENADGSLAGSCFFHPRQTHVALGIMNVHPDSFGKGIASAILRYITDFADRENKPVRLVSSAMNLDSFSLYTRAGFVPRAVLQDIIIEQFDAIPKIAGHVREATIDDIPRMVALEARISHIRRDKDYHYFVENRLGIWHVLLLEDSAGALRGFLCSVAHPASTMLGPGVMLEDDDAAALIAAELRHRQGATPVFLLPADRPKLVRQVYDWGGRNLELHVAQVRGTFPRFNGVVMPTFMPETG